MIAVDRDPASKRVLSSEPFPTFISNSRLHYVNQKFSDFASNYENLKDRYGPADAVLFDLGYSHLQVYIRYIVFTLTISIFALGIRFKNWFIILQRAKIRHEVRWL